MKKVLGFNLKETTLVVISLLAALGRGSSWSICVQGYSSYVYFTFLVSLVSFCIINKWKISVTALKNNYTPLLLIVFLLPSIALVDPADNFGSNLTLIASVLSVYFVTLIYDRDSLIESFIKILYFFALVSLICYTLFNIVKLPYYWMPLLQKNNDSLEQFRTIIVYSIRLRDVDRNCGPFWEPSIFAIYLNFALLLELFYIRNFSKKRIIVFIVTIITTLSTGGIGFLAIMALIWIWNNKKNSLIPIIVTLAIVVIVIVGLDALQSWLLSVNYSLFSKIFFFSSNKSSMSRIYSILTNLEIWKQSPLLGVGQVAVDNSYYETSRDIVAAVLELNPSQSATPFIFLAAFGLGGLYYSWCWIKMVMMFDQFNAMQKVLFGIFVFLALIEVPHTLFMMTFYILFSLLHVDIKRSTK